MNNESNAVPMLKNLLLGFIKESRNDDLQMEDYALIYAIQDDNKKIMISLSREVLDIVKVALKQLERGERK